MRSKRARRYSLAVMYLALGTITILMARSQFAPPKGALRHSSPGEVLSVVERPHFAMNEGRIEFHMTNGEVWTYADYLPHYGAVAALGAGALGNIELSADDSAGRDYVHEYTIRYVYEISTSDGSVASYQEVAAAAAHNAQSLTYIGTAMMVFAVGFAGYQLWRDSVAVRGRLLPPA